MEVAVGAVVDVDAGRVEAGNVEAGKVDVGTAVSVGPRPGTINTPSSIL
jgi:hypothetical protein